MQERVRGKMRCMTNDTEADLVRLGYRVVLFGQLAELRKKVHLSRSAQAILIGVDPESLPKWERLDRAMNIETALRIGEWFWGAEQMLKSFGPDGIDFDKLVPISKAAQYMGMQQSDIEELINRGEVTHERLGVLGTYVYRTEMTIPSNA